MNLLKNLKLVLLASGIILSPKGSYAADHERDDALMRLTRPGPSQSISSRVVAEPTRSSSSSPSEFMFEYTLLPSFAQTPNLLPTPSGETKRSAPQPASIMHSLLPSFAHTPTLLPTPSGETKRSAPQPASIMHSLLPSFAHTPTLLPTPSGETKRSAPQPAQRYLDTLLPSFAHTPTPQPASTMHSLLPSFAHTSSSVLPQERIEDSSIPFNSSFSGASSLGAVPQGYTFVADPAQKAKKYGPTNVTQIEAGYVAVKGDGYVFYHQLPATAMKALDKKSFVFEVDVKSNTPGAYIQYWGFDPKKDNKKIMSKPHTGSGSWETLRINFTIDGNDSQFFLYPAILPAVTQSSGLPEVEVRNVKLLRN
ncbi:MAG: hypothetical protein K2P93_04840 [Alphaproteobacteria bacterium]|nr:hypothetical protein [Alphaproteobacteria bacterium]